MDVVWAWLISGMVIFVSLVPIHHAPADDAQPAARELPFPLIAIIEHAERLRSGSYQIRGQHVLTRFEEDANHRRTGSSTSEYEEILDAAFDFDRSQHLYRHRRVQVEGPDHRQGLQRYRWFLSTPGEMIDLKGDETRRMVSIHNPGSFAELWPHEFRKEFPYPMYYEPRLQGWAGRDQLLRPFEEWKEAMTSEREVRLEEEGNGIMRMELWRPMGGVVKELDPPVSNVLTWWCDERQGWQPVRHTWKRHHHGDSRMAQILNEKQEKEAKRSAEVSWEQHGDVWVVKSVGIHFEYGTREEYLLSIDWDRVNQPISPNASTGGIAGRSASITKGTTRRFTTCDWKRIFRCGSRRWGVISTSGSCRGRRRSTSPARDALVQFNVGFVSACLGWIVCRAWTMLA